MNTVTEMIQPLQGCGSRLFETAGFTRRYYGDSPSGFYNNLRIPEEFNKNNLR